MKNSIALLFGVLFLLGMASAVQLTGDFSVETDCFAPGKAVFVLSNETGSTQTYAIKAVGENSGWINLNGKWIGEDPLSVTLGPGQSIELYAFVKPQDCYVVPGDYAIALEVRNSDIITKQVSVKVLESRALNLEISPLEQVATQCQQKEFNLNVRNAGEHEERVLLNVKGIPAEWAKLYFSEMLVEAGQSKTVKLEVQPACNAEIKDYEFTVRAELEGTSFFVEKQATLNLQDRQEIAITGSSMGACVEKITQSTVKIKNNGLLEDSLALSIEGIDWASVQPASVTLKAGEEKTVAIVFAKTSAATGSHGFSLKAFSAKFGKAARKEFTVELSDCYGITIAGAKLNGTEAAEKPKVCIESRPVYAVSLANNSIEAIEAEISIEGINAVVSPAKISIAKGATKEILIEIDLGNEQPGEKTFAVRAKGSNFSMQKDFTLIAEDCYNILVDWDGLNKQIELDANCKSEPFTVKVSNQGARKQNISVSAAGPNWVYLEPQDFSIEPGAKKEIYLYFAPPFDTKEGNHTATISIKDKEGIENRQVRMMVYGGLYAELGFGSARIIVDASVKDVVESVQTTMHISLNLSNDSNSLIRVKGITARDANAEFDFKETLLQPAQSIEIPMTLFLGIDENARQFAVSLLVDTDKGTMQRSVEIDLDKKEPAAEAGLFGLAGLTDIALAVLFIAAIAIFTAIALRSEFGKERKDSGLEELAKEVQEIPGKKLEEIGRRKKGRKARNNQLKEIAEQVQKPAKRKKRK